MICFFFKDFPALATGGCVWLANCARCERGARYGPGLSYRLHYRLNFVRNFTVFPALVQSKSLLLIHGYTHVCYTLKFNYEHVFVNTAL